MKPFLPAVLRKGVGACLAGVAMASLTGCPSATQRAAGPARPSLGAQLKQQDEQLVGQRFRTLLDFESDSDTVFVAAPGRRSLTPHTGSGAFEATPPRDGESALQVKVDSLLYGARLPGQWTLLGAYVRPQSDANLTTMLLADGQVVAQNHRRAYAGEWVFAAVDLTRPELEARLSNATSIRLAIDAEGKAITIDNVLLVDNNKTLVEPPAGLSPAYEVKRRGFEIRAVSNTGASQVSVNLQDGRLLDEIGPLRLRIRSDAGQTPSWTTFYPDGRVIENGTMIRAPQPMVIESHKSPADVTVEEAHGRLDAATEGDAENDGYNEVRGAYQIVARTPRVALRLTPRGAPVVSPVLEIQGLPAGRVSAHVEGRLIESTDRLPDGTALVLLPLKLERATTVTVKVE